MPRPQSQPPKAKASMVIADELRRRIARGELLPGDALPSENHLTADLGYSKPTVREALRILEQEGLIEVKRGLRGGPEVRRLSISKVAQPLGVFLQIADVTVADVWMARDRIISAAVERLAGMPEVDLEPLERHVEALTDLVGQIEIYYLAMIEVAEVAVELAGSATDHLVVVALRHVIERELRAATEAAADDLDVAVAAEQQVAEDWRRILRNIRSGNQRAARLAYESQAALVDRHLAGAAARMTVGEAVRSSPEERARLHAADMSKRDAIRPAG